MMRALTMNNMEDYLKACSMKVFHTFLCRTVDTAVPLYQRIKKNMEEINGKEDENESYNNKNNDEVDISDGDGKFKGEEYFEYGIDKSNDIDDGIKDDGHHTDKEVNNIKFSIQKSTMDVYKYNEQFQQANELLEPYSVQGDDYFKEPDAYGERNAEENNYGVKSNIKNYEYNEEA